MTHNPLLERIAALERERAIATNLGTQQRIYSDLAAACHEFTLPLLKDYLVSRIAGSKVEISGIERDLHKSQHTKALEIQGWKAEITRLEALQSYLP
jgi:hypothetical protein